MLKLWRQTERISRKQRRVELWHTIPTIGNVRTAVMHAPCHEGARSGMLFPTASSSCIKAPRLASSKQPTGLPVERRRAQGPKRIGARGSRVGIDPGEFD
jgi:hypothetical protein